MLHVICLAFGYFTGAVLLTWLVEKWDRHVEHPDSTGKRPMTWHEMAFGFALIMLAFGWMGGLLYFAARLVACLFIKVS